MPVSKPISIYADTSKGAIFFEGSTVDPKFLGTVLASAHPTETNRIIIERTDKFQADGVSYRKLFRRLKISRITNGEGVYLTDTVAEGGLEMTRSEVIDYINTEANKTGVAGDLVQFSKLGVIDFILDETHTTIIMSNGDSYGVNAIKALEGEDGHIHLVTKRGDVVLYELEMDCATIAGDPCGTTLSSCVNALNALFSVSALGGGVVAAPVFELQDGADITFNTRGIVDPEGSNIWASESTSPGQHGAVIWSDELIDNTGEFFTVKVNAHAQYGIGLYDANADDLTEIASTSGNGHSGYRWSNWLYRYNGYVQPWTWYGSSSAGVYGPGWLGGADEKINGSPAGDHILNGTGELLLRIGINSDSFGELSYYDVDRTNDWIVLSRSSQVFPEGQYGLLVKLGDRYGRIETVPQVFHHEPAAPTLYYRFVESPDGNFEYPLFASAEEANYVDTQNGGAGESDQYAYVDDPSGAHWYGPVTGFTDDGTAAPTNTADLTFTEIPTGGDADFLPTAFSDATFSFTEGTPINIALHPADAPFTTTISGHPAQYLTLLPSGHLEGTLPFVSSDTTYNIAVTRTNEYGSSTGNLELIVEDNPSLSTIAHWTDFQGNLEQPSTIWHTENAVLQYDTQLDQGQEIRWDHRNYTQIGVLSATGESNKTTSDLGASLANWDLQVTIWTSSLNHTSNFGTGWTDNSHQSIGSFAGSEWKLEYGADGYFRLFLDDVLQLTGADHNSQPVTITLTTPEAFTVNTLVPEITLVDSAFAGDPPAGFTSPLTHGSMTDSVTLGDGSVATLDDTIEVGKRYIIPQTWVEQNVLPNLDSSFDKAYIGVPKATAAWGSVDLHADFDAVLRWEWTGTNKHKQSASTGDTAAANHITINSATDAYYDFAFEWDGTDLHVIRCSVSSLTSEPGIADGGMFTFVETYENYAGASPLPLVVATKSGGGITLSTTGLQKVDIPAAPAGLTTPWLKAVDFSGNAERMAQEGGGSVYGNPLQQNGTGIAMPTAGQTSSLTGARPWAVSCVFKHDGNSSNQVVWGQCEGAGTGDDNIQLSVNASYELVLQQGREGAYSQKTIGIVLPGFWYGLYIDFNGFRSGSPTVSELADAFRIKMVSLSTGDVTDVVGDWDSAARMTRTVAGNFYVGGRDANRSFHGQVASTVVMALRGGVALPTDAEIGQMVRDPQQWLVDYLIGNSYRATGQDYNNASFQLNDIGAARNTQVWLNGDGTLDAYAVIRNQVYPMDQNFTAIRMIAMVSNDIETVNVTGLTGS